MKLQTSSPVRMREPVRFAAPPARQTCFLVYYDGGLASLAALREACLQAKPNTKIIAVYLETIPQSQALGQDDCSRALTVQGILAAATVNAAMYGVGIKTSFQECHVRGPALLHLAEQHGNAKIFLGVDGAEPPERNPFASYVQALAPGQVVLVQA